MSITDELRGYVQSWRETPNLMDDLDAGDIDGLLGDFEYIADRIDAEYEVAIQQVLMGEGGVAATDENMSELGWIRLPKDADGVPIRFGDKVTVPWRDKVYEVRGFSYTEQLVGGQRTVWVDVYSRVKMGNVPLCGASSCRHHAPTVEDVLTEFGIDWEHESDCEDRAALLKEYAAKLKLAEEDA